MLVAVVALVVGVLAASPRVEAQPIDTPRVGILTVARLGDAGAQANFDAFRQGLRERGWNDGQNVAFEYRWADGKYERLPELASDLLRLKVKVIVGATTPLIQAVKDASGTAPIVMVGILDPVKAGFVASLARPGGNVTGLAGLPGPEVAGKQLELLKTAIPGLTRVAVLMNPANSAHPALTKEAEAVAPALGLRARVFTAQNPGDLDAAFAGMAREGAGAVLVLTDAGFYTHRERLADLAARARLPAMYGGHDHVTAGGLMAYGTSLIHQWQRAAMYVDRVLRGAKPADIPVEQPTRFELVINLKTARALGVTIPSSLLLRADHVIE